MRSVVSTYLAELNPSLASVLGPWDRSREGVLPVFANILQEMSTELALGVAAFVAVMVIFVVMRARGPSGAAKSTSTTTAQPFFPPPPKNPPLRPDQIVLKLERQKNREPGPALLLPRRPAELTPMPASSPAPEGAQVSPGNTTPPVPGSGRPTSISRSAGAEPSISAREPRSEPTVPTAPQTSVTEVAEAVAPQLSLQLLRHLEWKRFELLVQRYYETGGLRVTGVAGGVGFNLQLHRGDEAQPFSLVHCHPSEGRPVQLEAVTALAAEARDSGVEVVFVTSGNFSPGAQAFAQTKRISLITGDTFTARFNAVAPKRRAEILDEVMAGDYTTPSCRQCDVKLVLADEVEGRSPTWNCPRAPRCTFSLPAR